MREIKFRGKRIDNGEWVYGVPIQVGLSKCVVMCRDGGSLVDDILSNPPQQRVNWVVILKTEVIPETVGQYTGVKDKNGVEIYEGDILLYIDINTKKSCKTIVRFHNGTFWNTDMYFNADISTFEVIGNIYDGVVKNE